MIIRQSLQVVPFQKKGKLQMYNVFFAESNPAHLTL